MWVCVAVGCTTEPSLELASAPHRPFSQSRLPAVLIALTRPQPRSPRVVPSPCGRLCYTAIHRTSAQPRLAHATFCILCPRWSGREGIHDAAMCHRGSAFSFAHTMSATTARGAPWLAVHRGIVSGKVAECINAHGVDARSVTPLALFDGYDGRGPRTRTSAVTDGHGVKRQPGRNSYDRGLVLEK